MKIFTVESDVYLKKNSLSHFVLNTSRPHMYTFALSVLQETIRAAFYWVQVQYFVVSVKLSFGLARLQSNTS